MLPRAYFCYRGRSRSLSLSLTPPTRPHVDPTQFKNRVLLERVNQMEQPTEAEVAAVRAAFTGHAGAGDGEDKAPEGQAWDAVLAPISINADEVLLSSLLAEGGSGQVWRAEWAGHVVCVKRLHRSNLLPAHTAKFRRGESH